MKHVFLAAAAMLVASLGTAFAQDAANGEKVFNVCRPCHQVGPDAVNMLGPPLNGLDGRKAGSLPDFAYSAAMIPNINMMFAGISGPDKDQKIKDLWAYLSQFDADGNKKK